MGECRRPVVRYHGGKWKLAPWIIAHLPPHRVYVESFGGGASVLLRKQRSYAEVYNDLDGEIVNVFAMLRDRADELLRAIQLTPFARTEFVSSYESSDDPVEQARRTIARSFMGFGSAAICGEKSGFRANSNRSGTTPARDWANLPDCLADAVERLRGVVIENRDATMVMQAHDGAQTLHYVDPPYMNETRSRGDHSSKKSYKHEMTDAEHEQLAATLRALQGVVVLSGYRSAPYDRLYHDWQRIDRAAHADGARDRVESLWLSKPTSQQRMFA